MVQLFTNAVDIVRRNETKKRKLPKGTCWAILKNAESSLTAGQAKALEELNRTGAFTCIAWKLKEKLRWVRKATSLRSAKWQLTHFIRHVYDTVGYDPILEPVFNALATLVRHKDQIAARWNSGPQQYPHRGLNSLFQAVRPRARGYRNTTTFITMIYLIAVPIDTIDTIDILLKSA